MDLLRAFVLPNLTLPSNSHPRFDLHLSNFHLRCPFSIAASSSSSGLLPLALHLPAPMENARQELLIFNIASFLFFPPISCHILVDLGGEPLNVQLLEECSADSDCQVGLYCFSCEAGFSGTRCVRSTVTDQYKIVVTFSVLSRFIWLLFLLLQFAAPGYCVSRKIVDEWNCANGMQ